MGLLITAVLASGVELDLAKRIFGPAALAFAFVEVLAVVVWFQRLPAIRALEFFGRNSLLILCTHNLVLLGLRFVFDLVLNVEFPPVTAAAVYASVALGAMVPVIAIVNRRLPWMTGL
jgi:hypothetical protein